MFDNEKTFISSFLKDYSFDFHGLRDGHQEEFFVHMSRDLKSSGAKTRLVECLDRSSFTKSHEAEIVVDDALVLLNDLIFDKIDIDSIVSAKARGLDPAIVDIGCE